MASSSECPRRILIVEDERVIAGICRRVLTGEGFEVDVAANGKLAQRMVAKNRYDLCLLDIKMPSMNGEDFYRWLQEECPRLAERVVFTTGDVIGEGTEAFLEQIGRPCLLKPFSPDDLKNLIRQVAMERQCFVQLV
jgi:DNA-binding response OmpR family regulator